MAIPRTLKAEVYRLKILMGWKIADIAREIGYSEKSTKELLGGQYKSEKANTALKAMLERYEKTAQ